MSALLPAIAARMRRFAGDRSGSLMVEAIMVLPILIWGGVATMTFVDAFRHQTANLRTTYAIADLISRQTDAIGPDFLNGAAEIYGYLADRETTSMRISLFRWNVDDAAYMLLRSEPVAGAPAPTTAEMAELASIIPEMSETKLAIVVETWMEYEPAFKVGIAPRTFHNRVVTSPRFGPQLKFDQSK